MDHEDERAAEREVISDSFDARLGSLREDASLAAESHLKAVASDWQAENPGHSIGFRDGLGLIGFAVDDEDVDAIVHEGRSRLRSLEDLASAKEWYLGFGDTFGIEINFDLPATPRRRKRRS